MHGWTWPTRGISTSPVKSWKDCNQSRESSQCMSRNQQHDRQGRTPRARNRLDVCSRLTPVPHVRTILPRRRHSLYNYVQFQDSVYLYFERHKLQFLAFSKEATLNDHDACMSCICALQTRQREPQRRQGQSPAGSEPTDQTSRILRHWRNSRARTNPEKNTDPTDLAVS